VAFSIVRDKHKQVVTLEGAVTIEVAQELGRQLRERLEDGTPLFIEAGALERVDTAILQLLCSLRKTFAAFSIREPSQAFITAVDRRGLRRELLSAHEDA